MYIRSHHKDSAVSSRPFRKAGGLALVDGRLILEDLMLLSLSVFTAGVAAGVCSEVLTSPLGVFLRVHRFYMKPKNERETKSDGRNLAETAVVYCPCLTL